MDRVEETSNALTAAKSHAANVLNEHDTAIIYALNAYGDAETANEVEAAIKEWRKASEDFLRAVYHDVRTHHAQAAMKAAREGKSTGLDRAIELRDHRGSKA